MVVEASRIAQCQVQCLEGKVINFTLSWTPNLKALYHILILFKPEPN